MRVIGIDPDTRSITWVCLDEDGVSYWKRIEAFGKRAEDRIESLCKQLIQSDIFADWVYIEPPVMGVNAKALRDQAMVVGMLRYHLWRLGQPHSMVDNTTWKKNVVGSGKASKEEIKDFATSVIGLEDGLVQDVYDAAAIARFGFASK